MQLERPRHSAYVFAALLMLCAVCGLNAYGAPGLQGEPVRVGKGVSPPKKIYDVRPVYPADALAAGVEGVVIIEATISVSGAVQSAKVLRSIGLLDAAALAAVNQWRYEPTTLNGVAVPVIMTVTVHFTIDRSSQSNPTASPPAAPATNPGRPQVLPPVRPDAEDAYNRGVTLRDANRVADALQEFKRAVDLDPTHGSAWVQVGGLAERLGDNATALMAYNKALATRRVEVMRPALESRIRQIGGVPAAPGSAPGNTSSSGAPAGCRNTLAHIAPRLPRFAEPQLAALRAQILASTIDDIEASLRAQGLPLANAAALTLEQSKQQAEIMRESETCAARAFDGSEADLRRVLDARAYDQPVPTRMGSPMTVRQMIESGGANPNLFVSCLRAFAAADMAKIATDESAVQLTCRAAIRR